MYVLAVPKVVLVDQKEAQRLGAAVITGLAARQLIGVFAFCTLGACAGGCQRIRSGWAMQTHSDGRSAHDGRVHAGDTLNAVGLEAVGVCRRILARHAVEAVRLVDAGALGHKLAGWAIHAVRFLVRSRDIKKLACDAGGTC